MAKTDFLQIRLAPEDRVRIQQAASADYLDVSTWARRAILRAVEEWERTSMNLDPSITARDHSSAEGKTAGQR